METMKWSEAFNFIDGNLKEFREKNYPEIPEEYVISTKRWFLAGIFYISVVVFAMGFVAGRI